MFHLYFVKLIVVDIQALLYYMLTMIASYMVIRRYYKDLVYMYAQSNWDEVKEFMKLLAYLFESHVLFSMRA